MAFVWFDLLEVVVWQSTCLCPHCLQVVDAPNLPEAEASYAISPEVRGWVWIVWCKRSVCAAFPMLNEEPNAAVRWQAHLFPRLLLCRVLLTTKVRTGLGSPRQGVLACFLACRASC